MTAKERTLWEQAVRVLRQNNVTTSLAVDTRKSVTGAGEGSKRRALQTRVA